MAEVYARYDHVCPFHRNGTSGSCAVALTVPADMAPPVFVYYGIDNMYMNHRRMVLSRSDYQLRGDTFYLQTSLQTCEPMRYPRYQDANGTTQINTSGTIFPCGLAAWSFFNDSYVLTRFGYAPRLAFWSAAPPDAVCAQR